MKYKQKVDLGISIFLILIGAIMLILPLFQVDNIKVLINIIFILYTITYLVKFILCRKSKDYEGIHCALASIVILLANIFLNPTNSPRNLAVLIMVWVIFMSMAKLKKMDYYHDRRDRMWKVRTFILILFILSGILTSINLEYTGVIQIIVIGFFMFIHGILELFDPILKTLISKA